jgi:predicted kinase
VVSGAPSTGKTTLALRLAQELHLPALGKDAIKERLFEILGAPDLARSRQLGAATFAVLFTVAAQLLDARVSLVLEGNFRRGQSEAELQPLAARARAVLLHCGAAPAEVTRRYAARRRHPGHHDTARLADLERDLAAGTYEPLALNVPTLRVDTTDGYAPPFDHVCAFALRPLS